MPLNIFTAKKAAECQVHGKPSGAANKTLLVMTLASVILVIWHVWVYGPSAQMTDAESAKKSFLMLLAREIWDLLFDSHGILAELWDVFPYFIVGILLAGYIRTYKVALKLQTSLKRHGILSVFLASLVGMITPLCACGTLTTAISLLFARFPLAPVMALLVTSPLLSPSTYLLTLNDLGPEWTVFRTVAAFLMGMFAGTVTHLLRDKGFKTDSIFIEGAIPRGDFHDEEYPDERLRCNCKQKFGHRVAARTKNMFVIFLAKSSEMLWMVGKYVVVGVVIGAIVERYMPRDWVAGLFGHKGPLSIVWVTLGSVPIFLHQISASSILYHIKSSLSGTLDAGAGLAFMIGGPVTAMPTMVMFWTIFRKKVFFLYMFICIIGTIIISYGFYFLVFVPNVDAGNALLRNVGSISGGNSAVIRKEGKNVRMVMDPDGKGLIATYNNALEGQGGIVFDAGLAKYMKENADRYDNRQYMRNVAEWLEQNSSSTERAVLIYDITGSTGLHGMIHGSNIASVFEEKGFKIRITDRYETPVFSEQLLGEYGQLWLFFGESGRGNDLSTAELSAISWFIGEGRSMLIVAGGESGGHKDLAAADQLSSRYGVKFSGSVHHREELPAGTASYVLNRLSTVIGKLLKIVHKA